MAVLSCFLRLLTLSAGCALVSVCGGASVDREAVVHRHFPRVTATVTSSPLSVGNGGFAFTVDGTGLQSFGEQSYAAGFPLETLARWAWVQDENPEGFTLDQASRDFATPSGRALRLPSEGGSPAGRWLRINPRLHPLGRLGLAWSRDGGTALRPEEVSATEQVLDLWQGEIRTRFLLSGRPVEVITLVDPEADAVVFSVTSPWVEEGLLQVCLRFPRGHGLAVKNTPDLDWSLPKTHTSHLRSLQVIERVVGGLRYEAVTDLAWQATTDPHLYSINGYNGALAGAVTFQRDGTPAPPRLSFAERRERNRLHWARFWQSAATLDLAGSTDPRAHELERRVVLSQYLTAIQSVADFPPQESGLSCNTWYGKHHTEMIWWHSAHFALWGRSDWLAKNLDWYVRHLPEARALATTRGLRGARWAKMIGPEGRESPGVNPLILWNQPHPIYLSELLYRARPDARTLAHYGPLVEQTAEALAAMVTWVPTEGRYVLGPPAFIVQEIHDPALCQNPGFELTYWHWALGVAQTWRERQGLPRVEHWDHVRKHLARPAVDDGKYVAVESLPDTWRNPASRHDHPQMLMGLGFLPANEVTDRATMAGTFDAVTSHWDWETKIWGWDYPMIAMTALRLENASAALDWLLRDGPNNHYLANGHCPQRSDEKQSPASAGKRPEIAAYLPANGALLATVAMMVSGWDGGPRDLPGFPRDGTWQVRAEGWSRLP